MLDLKLNAPNVLKRLAVNEDSWNGVDFPFQGRGAYRMSSYYSSQGKKLFRRQFTSSAKLELHDQKTGKAAVAIADAGSMSLAYIRTTGHNVSVTETQRPTLLVLVSGGLLIRNEFLSFEHRGEPWVMMGRGSRETRAFSANGADCEAFVLSLPARLLGNRLKSLERLGGLMAGDVYLEEHVQLARLILALATQLTQIREAEMITDEAASWTTILTNQIERCVDSISGFKTAKAFENENMPGLGHVRQAEKFIAEQLQYISSITEIASHVGVSERTLQNAFRRVRGASPKLILNQSRLLRARDQLLNPDGPATVSAICNLCGIAHHGRFSKEYKKVFGESPVATLNARSGR
ncbi:AraC family transcriptional regulator [Ruegeria sp. AD91A]|uniref:helix-turn-helix transcriptional regulator n=1 Tax=Ruegeria sp. AD91A TaxID=2293862 RepID=UPI000E50E2D3|nr:response regulator transcription factor [Ruegeria sp. AD91A]AXT27158.1 AraC family transcriptional regulator [Ruegeria sp. AD91A]